MKKIYLLFALPFLFLSCSNEDSVNEAENTQSVDQRPLAKFEPPQGKCILFVGQDLESIGGLDQWNDGYMDHFEAPGGFTMYTDLMPGSESFGHVYKGLSGLTTTDEWGDSPSNMSLQVADPDFANMALAIGLDMKYDHEIAVAKGQRDDLIKRLGEWIKDLGDRPVFLRIGYEFDGHGWNSYDRESYISSYRRIKDMYDEMGLTNVAYVWQSCGWASDEYLLEDWYPGDEYVDWCSFSFFARWREQAMIEFARKKGKPVFIAEATPTISDHMIKFDGDTKETILSNPEQASEAWEKWFTPFFKCIHDNEDVVKAISYINCNWRSHEMWKGNPTFRDIDARLQTGDFIKEKWLEEINSDRYLKATPDLFEILN